MTSGRDLSRSVIAFPSHAGLKLEPGQGCSLVSARILCHQKSTMSIRGVINSRGRPATGKGTPVTVRLQPDQLAALDAWIGKQSQPMTRPEAVRRILQDHL